MKITIVGAGAVGASCAEYIAIKDFASEVVLLDIREGFAEGKALKNLAKLKNQLLKVDFHSKSKSELLADLEGERIHFTE